MAVTDRNSASEASISSHIGVLYRLALESAPAGSTLHGVGEGGIQRRVIAEAIAGKLGLGTRSITDEEAPRYLGHPGHPLMSNTQLAGRAERFEVAGLRCCPVLLPVVPWAAAGNRSRSRPVAFQMPRRCTGSETGTTRWT